MADIDQNKIELLRTILPKGLSAGDGGLGNYSEKPNQTSNWPAFQSSTTETKLYTKSIEPYSKETPLSQTSATRQPWDIYKSNKDGSSYKLKVQAGTLNGFLPTNWDSEFICANNGLYYAKAVVLTDGQAITDVTIKIDTSEPVEQNIKKFSIDSKIEYLFGLFAEGQVYRVIGEGHIILQPEQWLVASADPPAQAGESPYDIYYRLQ